MERIEVPWRSLAAVAVLAGACGGDPAPAATMSPASPCVLEQRPVALADGTEVYIEPQSLFRLDDEWIVAGSPSYRYDVAPARDAIELSRFEHVAAVLGDPARAIGRPFPDKTVGNVISTSLGNGRWAAIFDEAHPDPTSLYSMAFWYGEHDGTRWTLLEPLPVPPGSNFRLRQTSALVRAGDRLVWVSYEWADNVGVRLHQYERRDGVWRYERLPDQYVNGVVLEVDEQSRLWMVLLGPEDELGFRSSIRLYRDGPPRELVSRVHTFEREGNLIPDLHLEVHDGSATVSWVVFDPEGSRAFARTGIGPDNPGTLVALDDNAAHLYSMTMPDGSVAWIADHEDLVTRQREIRLLRLEGARVVRAAAVPSPFTGFFRVQPLGIDEVLLVGPQMGLVSPETPVRSLILRLSTSC